MANLNVRVSDVNVIGAVVNILKFNGTDELVISNIRQSTPLNTGNAINIGYCNKLVIDNCKLKTNLIGMILESSDSVSIRNNTLECARDGIEFTNCDNVTVTGNDVDAGVNYYCMNLGGKILMVSNNRTSSGKVGINIDFSTDASVSNNSTDYHVDAGVNIVNSARAIISNNSIGSLGSQTNGVKIINSNENTVMGNNIYRMSGFGIELDNSDNASIVGNTVLSVSGAGGLLLSATSDESIILGNHLSASGAIKISDLGTGNTSVNNKV